MTAPSKGWPMDIELIKRKTAQIDRAVSRIETKIPTSLKRFERDYDAQDVVYRNFQIVVQNVVDIGNHVISTKGLPLPKTMGEVFDILASHRLIPAPLAKDLRKMVTVRNIIVHDYTRLDHKKAYRLVSKSLKVVPKFCLKFLKNRGMSNVEV